MVEYLLATDEQRQLAELAGRICEKELAPRLRELEAANNGLGGYPWDVHHKLADAGFYAMNIPKEWGGKDWDFVTRGLITEEISKTDMGFAFSFRGLGEKFNFIIKSHIPEADKKMWINKMLSGEVGGAFALTEPNAGTDAKNIETTAVKDGDDWVINGTKCFINNANTASFFGIYAWTDKSVGAGHGITCFLVERDRAGVSTKVDELMGTKLGDTGTIVLENVRVPEDHIVGELGRGFSTAMDTLDVVRPFNACFTLGGAQRAIDICKAFANERKAFGKYLIEHQGFAFKLAEMQMKVDAARAMTYYALEAGDRGIPLGRLASGTKAQAIEMCVEVSFDAIQLMGSYGLMKEHLLEKIMRDMRGFTIAGGTSEIQRELVARTMKIKR